MEIIDDGRRLGQAGRLNEFYKINKSDIFITFDADVILGNGYVIDEIVKNSMSRMSGWWAVAIRRPLPKFSGKSGRGLGKCMGRSQA